MNTDKSYDSSTAVVFLEFINQLSWAAGISEGGMRKNILEVTPTISIKTVSKFRRIFLALGGSSMHSIHPVISQNLSFTFRVIRHAFLFI